MSLFQRELDESVRMTPQQELAIKIAGEEFLRKVGQAYGITAESMHMSTETEIEQALEKVARYYVFHNPPPKADPGPEFPPIGGPA